MKLSTAVIIGSLSALAFAAQAAGEAKKNQAQNKPSMSQSGAKASSASAEFDRLDKNKDGQLSREEFAARGKAGARASAGKSSSATGKASTGASASGGASSSGSASSPAKSPAK